jgi:hypothetical protein
MMLIFVSVKNILFTIFSGRTPSEARNFDGSVTPRTVVQWHRAGFRLYWKWLSRTRQVGGRKPVSRKVQALIFRMAAENPTWGAPRIHGELQKLGFNLRAEGIAMASASFSQSRCWEALADHYPGHRWA